MKTQLSTRSLTNLVVSAIVAATLNTAVSAQPRPDNAYESDYAVRLDNFVEKTERSIKYEAPTDLTIERESDQALKNLDKITEGIENGLAYKAPVELEDQSVQNLEQLAVTLMDELKYRAPETDNQISNSLRDEKDMMAELKYFRRPVKVEVFQSPQDSWLINAGYYKSTREPAWNKVKKALNANKNEKQFVSEF